MTHYFFIVVLVIFLTCSYVQAVEFSTSVRTPTPISPEGSITGSFPRSEGRIAYYFFVDLQKGELLTQIFFTGQIGKEKRVELALLDENANLLNAYWIQGVEKQRDAIRSFPVKKAGRQLLRVTVSGPETDEFRLEFGGSALPIPSSLTVPTAVASTSSQDSNDLVGEKLFKFLLSFLKAGRVPVVLADAAALLHVCDRSAGDSPQCLVH